MGILQSCTKPSIYLSNPFWMKNGYNDPFVTQKGLLRNKVCWMPYRCIDEYSWGKISKLVEILPTCVWAPWNPTGTVVAIQIGIAPRPVRVIIRVTTVVSRRLSCALWERIIGPVFVKVVKKTPIKTHYPFIYCVCDRGVVFKWCTVIVARRARWNEMVQWSRAIWHQMCVLSKALLSYGCKKSCQEKKYPFDT